MGAVTQADEYAASAEVSARPDGRVTIPVQLRRAAGIEPGRRLVVYVEQGRVVIEERSHLLERVQREAIAAARAAGHTGSAVAELLAERRAETARDDTTTGDSPNTDTSNTDTASTGSTGGDDPATAGPDGPDGRGDA
jgi:bifunctional DNA-binding transcriptional regulator/antitoxin component of YhaV-PrlF toxin-antitoxin module